MLTSNMQAKLEQAYALLELAVDSIIEELQNLDSDWPISLRVKTLLGLSKSWDSCVRTHAALTSGNTDDTNGRPLLELTDTELMEILNAHSE